MRKQTPVDLSFHSSSDCSVTPIYLDDDGAPRVPPLPNVNTHESSGASPGSEAFASPSSANVSHRVTPRSPMWRPPPLHLPIKTPVSATSPRPPARPPPASRRSSTTSIRPPGGGNWPRSPSTQPPYLTTFPAFDGQRRSPSLSSAPSLKSSARGQADTPSSSGSPSQRVAMAKASDSTRRGEGQHTSAALPQLRDVANLSSVTSPVSRTYGYPSTAPFLSAAGSLSKQLPPLSPSRRLSASAAGTPRTSTPPPAAVKVHSMIVLPPPSSAFPSRAANSSAPAGVGRAPSGSWADSDSGAAARHRLMTLSPRASSSVASSGFSGAFQSLQMPYESAPSTGAPSQRRGMPLAVKRIRLSPSHEPFASRFSPMVHSVRDEVDEDPHAGEDGSDAEDEQQMFEVDLVSALRGYLHSPNECFGHLVAAALTTRSSERPVTGEEIKAAEHNPYLVRLIIDSGRLDVHDPVAQQNVQETLNLLFPTRGGPLNPVLFEFLASFFRLPFIKLSREQYLMLKNSGFKYVALMHEYAHVLPEQHAHTILVNYCTPALVTTLVLMICNIACVITCTISIALVLAHWMTVGAAGYQEYGFYTLIVYGGGYALYLVSMIFSSRRKVQSAAYGTHFPLDFPSPYVIVVPVVPIFELQCLVTFVRSLPYGNLFFTHDVIAAARLSSMHYAALYGIPQLITQTYFNHILFASIPAELRYPWSFYFLEVTAIVQWGIALIGCLWMMLMFDSTNALGFACDTMPKVSHPIERLSALPNIIHYLMIFITEVNIYFLTLTGIEFNNIDNCQFLGVVIVVLSAASIFIALVTLLVLMLTQVSQVYVSASSVPLALIQVALIVVTAVHFNRTCLYFEKIAFRGALVFGYIAWTAYLFCFVFWMVFVLLCAIRGCNFWSVFPRSVARFILGAEADGERNYVGTQPVEGNGAAGSALSGSESESVSNAKLDKTADDTKQV